METYRIANGLLLDCCLNPIDMWIAMEGAGLLLDCCGISIGILLESYRNAIELHGIVWECIGLLLELYWIAIGLLLDCYWSPIRQ